MILLLPLAPASRSASVAGARFHLEFDPAVLTGMIEGVLQVNCVVPTAASPPGVTVAIR
jgi:hypothetical protein